MRRALLARWRIRRSRRKSSSAPIQWRPHMSNRRGLGRGLDALIPGSGQAQADVADGYAAPSSAPRQRDYEEAPSESTVYLIPIDAIGRNEQQPRAPVEESDDLYDLANSIREYGLLQPLIVSYEGEDAQGQRY